MDQDDQVEIWFSLLQRSCLQPNHFVTATALETSLGDYMSSPMERKS
jgi:hypothetical protein